MRALVGFYHSLVDWHFDQYDCLLAKVLPCAHAGNSSTIGLLDHVKSISICGFIRF